MRVLEFLGSQAGRVARAVLGVVMVAVGVGLGGGWWVLAVIGLVPVATAALDVCLLAPLMHRPLAGRTFRTGH